MPIFTYKARDNNGLAITGELEIENKELLVSKLEKMGYLLIYAEERNDMLRQDIFSKYKKVKSKEIVEFSVEVATLIEAGVSLMGALDVMEEQSKGSIFHSIIKKISQDIKEGKSFSEALSEHPKTFSKLYVNMVRAGEATGELDEILKSLSILLEVSEDNKARVKSAMMYPLAMLIVSILVVLFLLVKVLPNFVGIFSGAGIMLPLPTRIMLWISNTVINYWLYMGGIVGGIIYGINRYNQTPKGRYYIDLLKLKVPIFGDILKKSAISRFTRTFGTLMKSNVPVLNSLEIVKNTANNEVISRIIENIKNTVSEGGSIAEQIEISGVFPKIVSKMITVGENSGALDAMLLKVSDFYDSEVENRIKGLTSILEPIMIVGMGLVIGVIVLSVMLPMFDMMQVAKS